MWGDTALDGYGSIQGHNTFVFTQQNGTDYIYDFRSGEDKIELIGIPTRFADLNIEVLNGNSIIHFDATNSVTVYGAILIADDFILPPNDDP